MEKITINGVEYMLTPVENETVNKIEPKFKVGDWIVSNFNTVCYVESISEKNYHLRLNDGYHEKMSINYVDRNFHLWTIDDAKDGDVIFYDDGWTCIFKNIHGIWYSSYCFITADGEFHTGYERHAVDAKLNGNANPATKEQRDILMKAMADAGYTFDFEKKELKKIEQKPDADFSDLRTWKYIVDAVWTEKEGIGQYLDSPFTEEVAKKLQKRFGNIGQKPQRMISAEAKEVMYGKLAYAWSEEDEKMFDYALDMIEWYSGRNEDKSRLVSDWLNLLKQKIGG